MHYMLSCIATFAVLHCRILPYIPSNDEAYRKAESGLRRRLTMLLSFIRAIQAFRDYQRNVAELSQLSDRELADIGLDRSDIQRVAAGAYNG
jgi:uncharacterized protein YjiS (DUF1127 family)